MINVEVFVGGGRILPHDLDRGRSDCVVDERRTDNDLADDADGRKPKPDIDEISDAVLLEDRGHAGQSAVSTVERHLKQCTRLAVDSEQGFEQEPYEDSPDRELAHRHHADHDDVRARDTPNLPQGRQVLAQQQRGGHQCDQLSRQLPPDGEYILWKEPSPTEKSAHPFRAQPEDEKTADYRGGNEELAQQARPALNAEQANTNERTTSDRPISSTLPGMLSSPGGRHPMPPVQSQSEMLHLA